MENLVYHAAFNDFKKDYIKKLHPKLKQEIKSNEAQQFIFEPEKLIQDHHLLDPNDITASNTKEHKIKKNKNEPPYVLLKNH